MYAGKSALATIRRSQSAAMAPKTATGVLSRTLHGSDQLSYSAASTIKTKSREKPKITQEGTPCRACCSSRSEEHTSELQSQFHLVCRLLLEKKKKKQKDIYKVKKKKKKR